ncbi:MAG: ribonuclease Z [Candidatus Anstonellales archaeon]
MELTFLGTSGTAPTLERGMPSIAVHFNDFFLLDAGEGTQRQMMRYKVPYGRIAAVYITHSHLDHYLGLFGLLETLKLNKREQKLKVFAPFPLPITNYSFVEFTEIEKEGRVYEGESYEVFAYRVEHSQDSYGFIIKEKDKRRFYADKAHEAGLKGADFKKIEEKGSIAIKGRKVYLEDITYTQKGRKVVYAGDSVPSKRTVSVAKDAELLIHEATYASDREEEARERRHSTAKDAAMVAKEAGAKQLILTHFSSRYEDEKELEKEAKKVFKNATAAHDGMKVKVKR